MPESNPALRGLAAPGVLLVLATALVSGVSTFVNAYAVAGINSDAFVAVRNLAVALLIVPVALVGRRAARPILSRSDWGRLAAIGVIGGAIPFLLFFRGLQMATAAGGATTASFVYRTLFLMASVLGIVALGERLRWRIALGAALLLGGSYLMLSLTSPLVTDGTLYVLGATVLWAIEYTISKRALRDLPSSAVALGRMGIGAAALFGYLAVTSQLGAIPAMGGGEWLWVLISATFLVAFVATWYAGLQRLELGTATSVLVLGFPVTFLLSVILRGSPFTLGQAVGAIAVAVGVVAVVGLALFRETGRYLLRAVVSSRSP